MHISSIEMVTSVCEYNFVLLSVSKVSQLVSKLTSSYLCVGNLDEAFLKLPSIRNGIMRDHSRKLNNC